MKIRIQIDGNELELENPGCKHITYMSERPGGHFDTLLEFISHVAQELRHQEGRSGK